MAGAGGWGEAVALQATGLTKSYRRRTWALRGVDLSVPAGSVTALVGPNAAGKSTLIKTWIGFERPTAGSVSVFGIDPWRDRAAALAQIGYVPQSPSLYRGLSVTDHLDLASDLRPGFDASTARDRLERLDIPLDSRAGDLSGGQQAQVHLCLALGTRAKVLLLDEPLASLDPLARREFLNVLAEAVRSDGVTALLSSHVITDIQQACDRLVVLGVGQLLFDGRIAEALAQHGVGPGSDIREVRAETEVATFAEADGSLSTLHRVDGAPSEGVRPATLEEVVLGYLVAGRTTRRAAEAA
ncbi:MAG: ABC transporter ATP-binding protein [Chloroflexi bacterium]|nr:ABC transporter ATP-binding protein [Chloroflexota bacterium]